MEELIVEKSGLRLWNFLHNMHHETHKVEWMGIHDHALKMAGFCIKDSPKGGFYIPKISLSESQPLRLGP